jgi:hypothetical protein
MDNSFDIENVDKHFLFVLVSDMRAFLSLEYRQIFHLRL